MAGRNSCWGSIPGRGVCLNRQDNEGITPLIWAAPNGHAPMVKLLLEAGADDEVIDFEGRTALGWTIQNDHEQIERMLSEVQTAASEQRPPQQ